MFKFSVQEARKNFYGLKLLMAVGICFWKMTLGDGANCDLLFRDRSFRSEVVPEAVLGGHI